MSGLGPREIIELATACGALKQSIVGDWAIINRQDVERYMQNGASSRIMR
jgi:2-dehydro-3-deoxygluconokinase